MSKQLNADTEAKTLWLILGFWEGCLRPYEDQEGKDHLYRK